MEMARTNIEVKDDTPIMGGASITVDGATVKVKGKGGTLQRVFSHPKIRVAVEGKNVAVIARGPSKKERALVGTWMSHIKNMMKGVTEGFLCTMKIVYSHFPMKAIVRGNEFVIENFLGERHPRTTRIMGESKIQVKGDIVEVTGPDKEHVGQTAANIEQCTRIKNKDPRVFQDGIYITQKAK
jgi:large subunit ribosomal protein L6